MLRPADHLDAPEIAIFPKKIVGGITYRDPESTWSNPLNPKPLKTPSRFARVHGQHAHGRIWGWLIADVETQA